jgi:hypothetical protein
LEQDGGEPQQPTPESEDPDGSPPAEPPPAADRPRRLLITGGIIAAVGVVAAIGFTVGGGDLSAPPPDGDDDDLGITLPTGDSTVTTEATTTVAAPTTAAPTTTVAPTTAAPTTVGPTTTVAPTTAAPTTVGPTTTVAPTTAAPTTVPPTTATAGGGAGGPTTVAPGGAISIASIVPDIAASRHFLATPQQRQTTVDQLLASGGRHDVALPGTVATLCATVELAGPIEVSGQWERDGQEISETGLVLRNAPGFGDCIDNDGEPIEPGVYQFVATDSEGTDSAAASFVVDAARIDQQFVNNGEEPVCAILIAPTDAGFFEDYVFASPLPAGAAVVIPIADVRQDVRVSVCPGSEPRDEFDFDFDPTPGEPRALIP